MRSRGVSTLADMRNLNSTITAIRFISNHPIRIFCLNPTKLAQNLYLHEQWNTSESYRSILEKSNASHRRYHGQKSTITYSIMNFVQSDEVQPTIDSKLKLFAFSTKSTNLTAKYTQTDRKKTKRSDT
jgi:hypothetical protein